MKMVKSILLAGGASLAIAAVAQAADIPTKKAPPPPAAPAGPVVCTNAWDFFETPCTLSVAGVTLYGTIDMGVGYNKFGAGWDPNVNFANNYLISKAGKPNVFDIAGNPLSQSNVGVKVKEDIANGWSFVGQFETGFDPYSLQLANGPLSLANASPLPLSAQRSSGDSARAGQWDNSQAFFGFSNPTFGTLTYGRQNTLLLDGVNAYDPMGGSYAFSVIGFSGTTAGGGNTENTRSNEAFKYRLSFGNFRVSGLAQVGGYEQGNASTGLYQGGVGFDFNGFSFDAIGSYVQNSEKLSTYNAVPGAAGGAPLLIGGLATPPGALKDTISNDTDFMALGKYKWDKLTLYGGYEWIRYANPDSYWGTTTAGQNITTLGGYYGVNQGNKFYTPEDFQVFWGGFKYAILPNLDGAVAYYHYYNAFYQSSAAPIASCSNSSHSNCSGELDAVSGLLDWRFLPKADAYIGMMWSQVSNGQANGYQTGGHVNLDPTIGVRFRF